jgi:hypothetical protein
MNFDSGKALAAIRNCVRTDHFLLLAHFWQRMTQRGLIWPDVLAVLDEPTEVRSGGLDRFGRDKWLVRGIAADGLDIELVCALDLDDKGEVTVFITLYTR